MNEILDIFNRIDELVRTSGKSASQLREQDLLFERSKELVGEDSVIIKNKNTYTKGKKWVD